MVMVAPTTSYVKRSPLTSAILPNSNITAAAKFEMRRFFMMLVPFTANITNTTGATPVQF
jgi:hypothetical protein